MFVQKRGVLPVVCLVLLAFSATVLAYDKDMSNDELIKAYEWVEVASWEVDSTRNIIENGLTLNGDEILEDGRWVIMKKCGEYGAFMVHNNPKHQAHLYFQIDDDVMFDLPPGNLVLVTLEFLDEGTSRTGIQFDSHDATQAEEGAYTHMGIGRRTGTEQWTTRTFLCREVRFANRQNGDSDFRMWGDDLAFTVRKLTLSVIKQ